MKQTLLYIFIFLLAIPLISQASNTQGGEEALVNNSKVYVSAAYPNPAENGVAYLDFNIKNENAGIVKIMVFNVLGSKVQEYNLQSNNSQLQFNTSRLQSGLYFYTLTIDGQNIATKRLLVKN